MSTQQPQLNDFIKQLPLNQRVPIVALRKLVTQRQNIDNEQQQSIAKIKLSYQQKLKPLLQRASQIIRGSALKQQQLSDATPFLKPSQNILNYTKGKIIDNYWNAVLGNSPLVDEITQQDQKVLSYILDIQIIFQNDIQDNGSISLKFVFKENPYFEEKELVRHLRVKNGQMLALEGDSMTVKDGKYLTHEKKKITNKKTGESKIEKGKKIKSFFDLFLDWNAENPGDLARVGNFMVELSTLIVMDSLDYFLGLISFEEAQDQDDQDDDDDIEQEEGNKKIKE